MCDPWLSGGAPCAFDRTPDGGHVLSSFPGGSDE